MRFRTNPFKKKGANTFREASVIKSRMDNFNKVNHIKFTNKTTGLLPTASRLLMWERLRSGRPKIFSGPWPRMGRKKYPIAIGIDRPGWIFLVRDRVPVVTNGSLVSFTIGTICILGRVRIIPVVSRYLILCANFEAYIMLLPTVCWNMMFDYKPLGYTATRDITTILKLRKSLQNIIFSHFIQNCTYLGQFSQKNIDLLSIYLNFCIKCQFWDFDWVPLLG